jgi:microcystin-dependent protein
MKRASLLSASALAAALIASYQTTAAAQSPPIEEAFTGQLMLVGFAYCPNNWVEANGQTLSIVNGNQELFSLLGTYYGGDGYKTMKLPDLRGRVPVQAGQGTGLVKVDLGQKYGNASVNLTVDNLPPHNHTMSAGDGDPNTGDPAGAVFPTFRSGGNPYNNVSLTPSKAMNAGSIAMAGKNAAVDIRPPSLGMRWCICLRGRFPSKP